MEYFAFWFRLEAMDRYAIWISNEKDSLAVEADGLIPTFTNLENLGRYANLHHYEIQEEAPILLDLDWAPAFSRRRTEPIVCEKALSAWNLFADVANSLGDAGRAFRSLDSQRAKPIYEKLFGGNNLPAITREGREYIPEWSPDEVASLAEILSAGLDMFKSNTRNWPPT